jgi:CRP/FNR family transcriptional regulator
MDSILASLRQVPYLSTLEDDAAANLASKVVQRSFARGHILFLEEQPCEGLYVVTSGRVKVFKVSPQGRELVLNVLGPGDAFNEVAVLDGGPNPASAATMTPSTLLILAREPLLELIGRHPPLAQSVIEHLASRTRHLVSRVEDLSFRTVSGRLARLLLEESDSTSRLPRSWTHEEIASRLGTAREVISRTLGRMESLGILRRERHQLIILDPDALDRLARG